MSDHRYGLDDRFQSSRHDRELDAAGYGFSPYLKWLVAGALLVGLAVFAFNTDNTQTATNPPPAGPRTETTGAAAPGDVRPAAPDRNVRPAVPLPQKP